MAGTRTRTRTASDADADTTCKFPDCGDPRSEHSIDGKTCFHNSADEGEQPQLVCPCRGFSLTEESARLLQDGEPTNAETLPDTGPVTEFDVPRDKDGALDEKALEKVVVSSPEPGDGGGADGT